MTALLLYVTCREGKEIPGTPGKINPWGKQCSCQHKTIKVSYALLFAHYYRNSTFPSIKDRLKRPKCSSEDKCQLVMPSLHLPYLIYPSMHWYSAQQGPSMPRFCVQASLFNNPQKQKHFRKKCKLKGPNHLTLPACSLHAVPFNDSLDQSGDGREKEKRACSHFSLYRHEIVVKALLSVWGGGEACGHCCF